MGQNLIKIAGYLIKQSITLIGAVFLIDILHFCKMEQNQMQSCFFFCFDCKLLNKGVAVWKFRQRVQTYAVILKREVKQQIYQRFHCPRKQCIFKHKLHRGQCQNHWRCNTNQFTHGTTDNCTIPVVAGADHADFNQQEQVGKLIEGTTHIQCILCIFKVEEPVRPWIGKKHQLQNNTEQQNNSRCNVIAVFICNVFKHQIEAVDNHQRETQMLNKEADHI